MRGIKGERESSGAVQHKPHHLLNFLKLVGVIRVLIWDLKLESLEYMGP